MSMIAVSYRKKNIYIYIFCFQIKVFGDFE